MKNAVNKILEINGIIKSLDPALQERASDVLLKMAFGNILDLPNSRESAKSQSRNLKKLNALDGKIPIERPQFFAGHEHDRLKDNVHLIVAWLYSIYGLFPVETKLMRQTAAQVNLMIPNRPDNTMRQAKCKGHALYEHVGRGWQLSNLGERYVQQRYGVMPGEAGFDADSVIDNLIADCRPNSNKTPVNNEAKEAPARA